MLSDAHLASTIRQNVSNVAVCRRHVDAALMRKFWESPEFVRYQVLTGNMLDLLVEHGGEELKHLVGTMTGIAMTSFVEVWASRVAGCFCGVQGGGGGGGVDSCCFLSALCFVRVCSSHHHASYPWLSPPCLTRTPTRQLQCWLALTPPCRTPVLRVPRLPPRSSSDSTLGACPMSILCVAGGVVLVMCAATSCLTNVCCV